MAGFFNEQVELLPCIGVVYKPMGDLLDLATHNEGCKEVLFLEPCDLDRRLQVLILPGGVCKEPLEGHAARILGCSLFLLFCFQGDSQDAVQVCSVMHADGACSSTEVHVEALVALVDLLGVQGVHGQRLIFRISRRCAGSLGNEGQGCLRTHDLRGRRGRGVQPADSRPRPGACGFFLRHCGRRGAEPARRRPCCTAPQI
mmetsp:Transcript_14638/g.43316  ORF Transcript_14638/g.43316 Transcript_14638/m.43316 type:complete len:201 (-) Transcript_14638:724-1326(-)